MSSESYTPPTYFEQPHRIIGYRVVGFSPIRLLQEPEYAKCIITMAVNLEPTWASAWAAAQNQVKEMRSFYALPVKIGLENFDAFATDPAKVADYRHSVEVGNAPSIEVNSIEINSGLNSYAIAITAVLGEELDSGDWSDSDSE
jgi:hypothetical protein